MSFATLPLECCFLVMDAGNLNQLVIEQIVPICEIIQYQEANEIPTDSLAFDRCWTWNLLNDANTEKKMYANSCVKIEDYWSWTHDFGQERKVVKRRVRKSPQLEIEEKVLDILKQIQSNKLHLGYFMRKAPEKDRNYTLKRSSKFIGVSMNGNNWQAMINNWFGKKYIGTYSTEKEAAVAYDFYSFALHDWKHQTNFDYSVEIVEEMIESFLENNKIIIPSFFIDKTLS